MSKVSKFIKSLFDRCSTGTSCRECGGVAIPDEAICPECLMESVPDPSFLSPSGMTHKKEEDDDHL